MKKILILIGILCALKTNAQDYFITFTGAGASSTVSSVNVENLTSGTSLTISGSDILHLTSITTGVNSIKNDPLSKIKIYPNPMTDCATVQIYPPVAGEAVMKVIDITGNPVAISRCYLDNSRQDFRLSGMKTGLYLINVVGSNYHFSGKLICSGEASGPITIEKINSIAQMVNNKAAEKVSKGVEATVDMSYTNGDRLKFTGTSGNFRTIITDIPDKTKTIIFNLMSVIDKDSNIYHIVEIGDQTWLEENMKTTKYKDGLSIPLVTDNAQWNSLSSDAYSWYNNSKATSKDSYGALYNGFAIGTGKICPIGWHIPSMDEWGALQDYLIFNNYDYSKEFPRSIAKSLASKTLWNVPQPILMIFHGVSSYTYPSPSSVGLNPQTNNGSGFNAFPAGIRYEDGTYTDIGKMALWATNWGGTYLMSYYFHYDLSQLEQNWYDIHSGFSVRCLKGVVKTLPVLTTNNAYNITQTTAVVETSIPGVGESPITRKGVCWCEYDNTRTDFPTIDDHKTVDGTGIAPFISHVTGLKPGTLYYIRSYSINDEGVSYGNSQIITTDIADADGNIYKTFLPSWSNSLWMTQNLKTTRFNDNALIDIVTNNAYWIMLKTTAPPHSPGLCWYNNDTINKTIYGGLYNWFAVNTGKLCPKDWHVATDEDWTALGEYHNGGDLKETGTTHWQTPNVTTNPLVNGFVALPGGKRDATGNFIDIGYDGFWWTSTDQWITTAWHRHMTNDVINLYKAYSDESEGLSVRCVKN